MKVLVIPDVHLKPYMFTRAKELLKEGVAENAVCLMDIPDDWNKQFQIEEYVKAYDAAIDFVKEFPNSIWVYGNHDLCYLWDERESGFSYMAQRIVQKKLMELNMALPENNPIKYVHAIDNVIFCHGAVSQYFVDKYVPGSIQENVSETLDRINSLGHFELWCDDSPIWYRPQKYKGILYQADKILQVVGHTPMGKITRNKNVISCDVFSTYSDGTPIGTCEFTVVDTKTWEFFGVM